MCETGDGVRVGQSGGSASLGPTTVLRVSGRASQPALASLNSQNLSLGSESRSLDIELLDLSTLDHKEASNRHLVGSERSRLVGADDVGASEGLDRRQGANNRILLCHLLGSQGEAGGDDDGETFGDGGDGESDGDL